MSPYLIPTEIDARNLVQVLRYIVVIVTRSQNALSMLLVVWLSCLPVPCLTLSIPTHLHDCVCVVIIDHQYSADDRATSTGLTWSLALFDITLETKQIHVKCNVCLDFEKKLKTFSRTMVTSRLSQNKNTGTATSYKLEILNCVSRSTG